MRKRHDYRGGFALPTVLISSVVMLIVLAVSVSSVAAIRTTLKTQYYEQLAKAAGEAGVAYARACLAKNGNVPLWTDANPLRPSTDCAGNTTAGLNCPGDAGCWVTTNDNIRSAFSIKRPAVGADGRAISIVNNGYVELIRESSGLVWRTYKQPAAQVAVVPDLCSGAASSPLGWSNAVVSSNQSTLPNASTAQTITLANGNLNAGYMYFRKDFAVSQTGTYGVTAQTASTADLVDIYVDGVLVTSAQNQISTGSTSLEAGCHTMTARLLNKTLLPRASQFTAAVQNPGSAPVVATDSSWRVSAGQSAHYSQVGFYADPTIWTPVTDVGSAVSLAAWGAATFDTFSRTITPSHSGCYATCPPSSSIYMRDSKSFSVATDTEVKITNICDDDCTIYLDGSVITEASPWNSGNGTTSVVMTLTPGSHQLAARLYNAGAGANPSRIAISVVTTTGNTVLTRTDNRWLAANAWTSGTGTNVYSYEKDYTPSPSEIAEAPSIDLAVVGGGGGGVQNASGGGGGGGVRLFDKVPVAVSSYAITIGGGGAGAAAGGVGATGGYSQFLNTNYRALGGGGGAPRDGTGFATTGGSGGGGAGAAGGRTNHTGALGTAGQGSYGGNGTVSDASCNATGGGGGGAGGLGGAAASAVAGDGGAGVLLYLTGTRVAVGGGGGGSATCSGAAGAATDGGVSGSSSTAAAANTGGGGGYGSAGGSGVVIIRYKTGKVTATGGTITTATIDGIDYTIHRFTANGTFQVTAVN